MIKKFILFFITGFIILLFNKPVKAETNAGHSATFSSFFNLSYKNENYNKLLIKELSIRSILEKYNSPMINQAKTFVIYAEKYQLDPYLLPAIAGLESTFGRFIWPNSYNPFGWGGGYIIFNSWQEAINKVGYGLKYNYINKGATDIYSIGKIYSESPTWALRINWFIDQLKKEEEKIILYYENFPVKL